MQLLSLDFCTKPDPLVPAMAAFKGISLKFPLDYSMRDFEYSVDHMDGGHVDPKLLISSTVAFDAMPARFESLRKPNSETKVHVLIGS